MSIKDQIEARFKRARLDRDEPTKNVIGMVRAKVLNELKSGSGVTETDDLWIQTLAGYVKQQRKAIAEFEALGDRAADALAEARFEVEFCEQFLPRKLDEAATEELVRRIAAEQGISDAKQLGKLMGILMKDHKDAIDGAVARTVAARVLAG
jgi:uncharacterized protein YqeY